MGFTVGQEVLLIDGQRKTTSTVTVVKVGHKYAYIEQYSRLVGFEMDTGIEKGDYSNYKQRIVAPEKYAAEQQRSVAVARLRELGITGTGYGEMKYSTTTIEGIIRLLEADGGAITL